MGRLARAASRAAEPARASLLGCVALGLTATVAFVFFQAGRLSAAAAAARPASDVFTGAPDSVVPNAGIPNLYIAGPTVAPPDAAPEVPPVSAPEAPSVAAPEVPPVSAPEAPPGAAPDSPPVAASGSPPVAAPEAPPDAAPEAPPDAAPEAPSEAAAGALPASLPVVAADDNATAAAENAVPAVDAEQRDVTLLSGDSPEELPPMEEIPREPIYRNIFYLKTHKTGSTSIANALVRYLRRHRLSSVTAPGHIYITRPNRSKRKVDAMVAHHASFDKAMIASYLKGPPKFILTSIRLPLQRQLSWFRQQNREWEMPDIGAGSPQCEAMKNKLLAYFDEEWAPSRMSPSQWYTLMERSDRPRLEKNVTAILEQFDFVFLCERMRESYECFCSKTGVRLCDKSHPVAELNVKPSDSCVERVLTDYRSEELLRGAARDILLYEKVDSALTECQKDVPSYCRCA